MKVLCPRRLGGADMEKVLLVIGDGAEVIGAKYVEQPLVISGNLFCCRFKRECSAWMKAFVEELKRRVDAGN